jgi:hypothetical protein
MKEAAIEEEGLLMEDDDDADGRSGGFSALPKKVRYGLGFVAAFFALFFFFALILWGASRNQKPVVSVNVRRKFLPLPLRSPFLSMIPFSS